MIFQFLFIGDNLVVIGGNDGQYMGSINKVSNIELIKAKRGSENCDPTIHLQHPVSGQASIASDKGVITCGGFKIDERLNTPECYVLRKNGETRHFPSMKTGRSSFGLAIINDTLYAVGGTYAYTTMEMINLNTDSEWSQIDMPFGLDAHCVTTTQTTIVITGGVSWVSNPNPFSPPPEVSKK